MSIRESILAAERDYVASLYAKLDSEREGVGRELGKALGDSDATSPEARWQRQSSVERLHDRVHALRVADNGLCFGRIDDSEGPTYVGRVGLFDEDNEYDPLLVDWRAPLARPFYTATGAHPEGLVRRRRFSTKGRTVVTFHDDVLAPDDEMAESVGSADTALLAALNAPRESTMRDIVSTIQAEQDEIIRLNSQGVVVIEGGPGTGKTVVALHRVAYLLYTHRERLARRGVLVIGPNEGFLDYISTVLPSLGETSVVFATPGDLLPGMRVTEEEESHAKRIKGSLEMVDVLAAAVAGRQELPGDPIPIELSDVEVEIDAELAGPVRDHARATGLPHNDARTVFHEQLIQALASRAVARIGDGWLDEDDVNIRADLVRDVRTELTDSRQLRGATDRLWPYLTPQRLLAELFTSPERISAATPGFGDADRAALYRDRGSAWTVSDVPLLDEAVDLLGADRTAEEVAAQRHQEQVAYTKGVLDVLDTDVEMDDEVLRAVDLVDAETLAERHVDRDERDVNQRAIEDRDWTYGHIVVDEAQELSEMDWRVLMRRCPTRSMTIVGDLAQRQSNAGVRSWETMLATYVSRRWTYRELTINYRTPEEIMIVASGVLALLDPTLSPPESVRRTGVQPWVREVEPEEIAAVLEELVAEYSVREGSLGIIVPEHDAVDVDATVLTPRECKGLEFDVVVLVEPATIVKDGSCGLAELYVALTRATQELGVLHAEPLPAPLLPLE